MLLFLFCVMHLAMILPSVSDKHCAIGVDGEFQAPLDSSCDITQSGRGLLQKASGRQMHPAFDVLGEAVPTATVQQMTATKTAPAQEAGRQGASTWVELTKGIAQKQDTGYVMPLSVSDVSSVFPAADIGKQPHPKLLMIAESVGAFRSVEFVTVVIITVMSLFGILLAYLAAYRGENDYNEPVSSESEHFGPTPKYKSRLSPKTPARIVKTAEPRRAEPPRVVQAQLQDQFSPAPPAAQPSVQWGPASSSPPRPSAREVIPPRRNSPIVSQANPYQMQQSPPNTQPGLSGRSPEAKVTLPTPELSVMPATSSQGSSSRPLCPGLVVPKGNECVLAVPTFRAMNVPQRNSAAFFVRDRFGEPVIQVEILVQPGNLQQVAVLRTAISQGQGPIAISSSSPILASVRASFEAGGRPTSAVIFDARNELFAEISKDATQSRYVLTSNRMGVQVIFSGTFQEHRVHVANEAYESLAEVESCTMEFDPPGEYYRLRVVPLVDVGLILCGLLAIEHMEA